MGKLRQPPSGGSSVNPYNYDDTSEPNRVGLWLFPDTGNALDLIGSNDLTKSNPSSESWISVDYAGELWSNFVPTTIGQLTTGSIDFRNTSLSGLSPGTSSFTVEIWFIIGGNTTNFYINCFDQGAANPGLWLGYGGNTSTNKNKITVLLKNQAGSSRSINTSAASFPIGNGQVRKLRYVRDATLGKHFLYVNEEELLNETTAVANSSSVINFAECYVRGAYTGSGGSVHSGVLAMRVSHNATNNCGGPDAGA